jgi:hypothetical protein
MERNGTACGLCFGDAERYSTFIIKKTTCFVFLLYHEIFVGFQLDWFFSALEMGACVLLHILEALFFYTVYCYL